MAVEATNIALYTTMSQAADSDDNAAVWSNIHRGGFSSEPQASLGGVPSAHPLVPQAFNGFPNLHEMPALWAPGNYSHLYRLFTDFTPAQLTAGGTFYRAVVFYLYADPNSFSEYSGVKCWMLQPLSGVTVALQYLGANSFSDFGNIANHIPSIANETTNPGGVFSAPGSGSPLTIGTISMNPGKFLKFWLRLTIPPGQAAWNWDVWGMVFETTAGPQNDTSSTGFSFYEHLQAGVTITSITSDRAGSRTYQHVGETFTVNTRNSSATLTDPARNTILVMISGPQAGRQTAGLYNQLPRPLLGVGYTLGTMTRSSAGVYTFQWRPPVPGYYHLEFYAGEGAPQRIERNVLP